MLTASPHFSQNPKSLPHPSYECPSGNSICNFECSGDKSCKRATIRNDPSQSQTLNIVCSAWRACKEAVFEIDNSLHSQTFNLNCAPEKSCQRFFANPVGDTTEYGSAPSSLSIYCEKPDSCEENQVIVPPGSFDMHCVEGNSCKSAWYLTHELAANKFTCDQHDACYEVELCFDGISGSVDHNNNLEIVCHETLACDFWQCDQDCVRWSNECDINPAWILTSGGEGERIQISHVKHRITPAPTPSPTGCSTKKIYKPH